MSAAQSPKPTQAGKKEPSPAIRARRKADKEAEARTIADAMGPMDFTGLEQIAQYAEHEPSWSLGHVTAERLRMLADELRARADDDHETVIVRLVDLFDKAADTRESLSFSPDAAVVYRNALRAAAEDIRVAELGKIRERQHARRLEKIVSEMAQQIEECGNSEVIFSFSNRNLPQDAGTIGVDLASELAVELQLLQRAGEK